MNADAEAAALHQSMKPTTDHFYAFDAFRLYPGKRLLLRGETVVPLTAKVFDLLLLLVESGGALLEREELMMALWPRTVVEEGNLTQCVFVLRKVLGETRDGGRFIVTVPGRGYRFVAAVQTLREQGGLLLSATDAPARRIASIAILPLKVIGANKAFDYLGVGIADALISVLSRAGDLLVRPTTAILKYSNHGQDPMAAGRELKVAAVLDGTLQTSGGRLRVSVQLINVNTSATLWAGRFEEALTDVFALQDSMAEQIARQLALEALPPVLSRRNQMPADNVDVWQLYIKGRYFQDQRSAEGLRKSIACAHEVIALAPDFARGYACLADAYNLLGEYLHLDPNEAFPRAEAAVQQALALDPALAEAHASRAEILMFYERAWAQAERAYQTAIRLNPNYAAAHHWYAWLLLTQSRFDEALHHLRLAQRIDPSSLYIKTALGLPYYYQGDYGQAIAHYHQALEMDAGFSSAHYYLGEALAQQGDYAAAIASFQQVQARHTQQSTALLAHTYALAGQADQARAHLAELQAQAATQYISPYCLALIYTGLDETEAALRALTQAEAERAAWLIFLPIDPFLQRLHGEAQFAALRQRILGRTAGSK